MGAFTYSLQSIKSWTIGKMGAAMEEHSLWDKAMKIRVANARPGSVGGVSNVPPEGKAGQLAAPPAVSAATDQVQLSSLAQMAAAYDDSPTHLAKLSSLGATVSSGGYQVGAGVLSNSIIEASMQLSKTFGRNVSTE